MDASTTLDDGSSNAAVALFGLTDPSADLMPCPFCGSDDVLLHMHPAIFGIPCSYSVSCRECGASIVPLLEKARAAEAWNRRWIGVNFGELRGIAEKMLYDSGFSGQAGAYIEKQAEKILNALGRGCL